MWKASRYLEKEGYRVVNLGYPSTRKPIEELSKQYLPAAIAECQRKNPTKIHFLAHSLGGIVVRHYLQEHEIGNLGRFVMLSPPNNGSDLADTLKPLLLYQLTTGPAGQQIGTDAESVPRNLRPIEIETGVITGDRSNSPWFSPFIDGPDDGKVSIENAKLKEAADFLVLAKGHTFIMQSNEVLQQVVHFFTHGKFKDK